MLILEGFSPQRREPRTLKALQSWIGAVSSFAERLTQLVEEHRSANAFSKHSGIGQSLLRKYLAGGTPGLDKVVQIARATGVSVDWLATGEGPRDSRVESAHTETRTKEEQTEAEIRAMRTEELDDQAFVVMPLLDLSAAAGSGRLTQDFPEVRGMVALGEEYLRSIGVSPRYAQLLEIDGDSMFPTLKDRDIAVVDTSITEVRSDAVYAVVYGGLVVAKRIQINRDGSILLSSDNKTAGYRDERVSQGDLHELRIAGRIKGRVGGL